MSGAEDDAAASSGDLEELARDQHRLAGGCLVQINGAD